MLSKTYYNESEEINDSSPKPWRNTLPDFHKSNLS